MFCILVPKLDFSTHIPTKGYSNLTEQIAKCRKCFLASIFTNIKGSLEGNWKEREEGKVEIHRITMLGDKP